jgi:Sec-independent protein secretion pathway component TatC
MFPYGYVFHNENDKSINQSSVILECNVNDGGSFFSSCLFTFGFYYVLPLLIIGLCYSQVLIYIRHHRRRMSRLFVSNHIRRMKYF